MIPTVAGAEAILKCTPTTGARTRKRTPCKSAKVVPPSACPRTIDHLGTGATSTPCRNPSRRSWTIEIVAKIAVNKSTNTIMPAYKYSKYPVVSGAPVGRNDCPNPAPNSSQKTRGCANALIRRLRCRKNLMTSRHHKVITASNSLLMTIEVNCYVSLFSLIAASTKRCPVTLMNTSSNVGFPKRTDCIS